MGRRGETWGEAIRYICKIYCGERSEPLLKSTYSTFVRTLCVSPDGACDFWRLPGRLGETSRETFWRLAGDFLEVQIFIRSFIILL